MAIPWKREAEIELLGSKENFCILQMRLTKNITYATKINMK
jgi:hypothetical protein